MSPVPILRSTDKSKSIFVSIALLGFEVAPVAMRFDFSLLLRLLAACLALGVVQAQDWSRVDQVLLNGINGKVFPGCAAAVINETVRRKVSPVVVFLEPLALRNLSSISSVNRGSYI